MRSSLLLAILLLPLSLALAQDKKPDKKDAPRVAVAIPLGLAPGKPVKLTLRGIKLDMATAVQFAESKATAKILKKGKASVPNQQEPARWGDTEIEVEVHLPADTPSGTVSLVVVTPAGETPPHQLLVETALPVIPEKEPNNGFRQAQPVAVPQVIEGAIQQGQDVDVFRIDGQAGQRLVVEVLAGRYGSVLDSTLTLYDDAGRQLAANDDAGDSMDSRLEFTLPQKGAYYLSLADAHDQGGAALVYRLVVR